QARRQAIIDLGKIAEGEDISLRKKALLEKQKQIVQAKTLGQLFDIYVTTRLKEYEDPNNRYWNEVKRHFHRDVAPVLDPKTLVINITKVDVRTLMQAVKKESARMIVFSFLRPFFKWLVQSDYIKISPMADLKPPKASKERDRVLSDQEIILFWLSCEKMGL